MHTQNKKETIILANDEDINPELQTYLFKQEQELESEGKVHWLDDDMLQYSLHGLNSVDIYD